MADEIADKYLKVPSIRKGVILRGKVIKIGEDSVFVDIGYKTEGFFPKSELKETELKEGDYIEAEVVGRDRESGLIKLSYAKAQASMAWRDIKSAYREKRPIRARVVERVKGGYTVEYRHLRGFVPFSEIDVKTPQNEEEYIGKEYRFLVISLNERRKDFKLSRKILLESERKRRIEEFLSKVQVGQIVEGKVKRIVDYGAFLELAPGVLGLLHMKDIFYGRYRNPAEVLKEGQKLKVMILDFDKNKGKIFLGLKQLKPNPWVGAEKKYPVGSVVEGVVSHMESYGAFVELEEGVEGLIHISEFSWGRRPSHPSEVLKLGQKVKAKVLEVDPKKYRIRLSLRQLQPDPWEKVDQEFREGQILKVKVVGANVGGLAVELPNGLEGFIPSSYLEKGAKKNLSPGQQIEALVEEIDKQKRRIILNMRKAKELRLLAEAKEKYTQGQIVGGKVTAITRLGVWVDINGPLPGFIKTSELDTTKVSDPAEVVQPGDEVTAKVMGIDENKNRIILSRRRYLEDKEMEELKSYINETTKVTLGQILNLEDLKKRLKK